MISPTPPSDKSHGSNRREFLQAGAAGLATAALSNAQAERRSSPERRWHSPSPTRPNRANRHHDRSGWL